MREQPPFLRGPTRIGKTRTAPTFLTSRGDGITHPTQISFECPRITTDLPLWSSACVGGVSLKRVCGNRVLVKHRVAACDEIAF